MNEKHKQILSQEKPCVRAVCEYNSICIRPWSVQTWGFPDQFKGAKVAKRFNKSPLSHGLHEDLDEPKAEPPTLVLIEVHGGCEPTHDKEAALEPCPWLDPSMLPTFIGTVGEDAPAELIKWMNYQSFDEVSQITNI